MLETQIKMIKTIFHRVDLKVFKHIKKKFDLILLHTEILKRFRLKKNIFKQGLQRKKKKKITTLILFSFKTVISKLSFG